ncbi:MAG: hypothetical protein Q8O56_08825 [Solirubrobacteraceae bacterium]|nr:hypothetical protein [Solirubrobacteraceae bacterium]
MYELSEAETQEAHRAVSDLLERREDLRRACERAVVRWQWAAEHSDLHRPQPLYRERNGLRLPRLLDKPPSSPQNEQRYGLDANGEIVVAREYVGPGEYREELRVRRGETVIGFRWMETGEPAEVNIARCVAGRMQSYVTIWPQIAPAADMPHGSLVERYEWDGDRLDAIHTETVIAFADMPALPESAEIRASYDTAGRLVELREHSDRGTKTLYRAPDVGPPIAQLRRSVEDRLVELLPALLRDHVVEPIYCLALHYQAEWPLPPNVAIGVERDRRAWIQQIHDSEMLRLTVWNPAEFSSYAGESLGGRPLSEIDVDLARTLDAIPENCAEAARQGRVTLNRVARRLQKLDWRSICPVSDDFVVFAVDFELVDLEDNLRFSVPVALHRQLADQGLL